MTLTEVLHRVVTVLADLEIPYALVGAWASNAYGIPRATQDVDVVAVVNASRVEAVLQELGSEFRRDAQRSFETATATSRHVIHHHPARQPPLRIELFELSDDPFDRERFARRQKVSLRGAPVFLLTPEDTLLTKLRWYEALKRPKDWQDARGIVAVQAENLDGAYVRRWSDRLGTSALLDQLRGSLPP
ncbi:MAG: hypothetical protein ACOC46_00055 [Pirellulales bacterium]